MQSKKGVKSSIVDIDSRIQLIDGKQMIDGTFDINDYDSNEDAQDYGDEDYDEEYEDQIGGQEEDNERTLIRQAGNLTTTNL
jgi:hypothetical protein